MDREPLIRKKTAISYKTEEKTVMRGYDLSELAEKGYSFYDALFVLFQNTRWGYFWSIPCHLRQSAPSA